MVHFPQNVTMSWSNNHFFASGWNSAGLIQCSVQPRLARFSSHAGLERCHRARMTTIPCQQTVFEGGFKTRSSPLGSTCWVENTGLCTHYLSNSHNSFKGQVLVITTFYSWENWESEKQNNLSVHTAKKWQNWDMNKMCVMPSRVPNH